MKIINSPARKLNIFLRSVQFVPVPFNGWPCMRKIAFFPERDCKQRYVNRLIEMTIIELRYRARADDERNRAMGRRRPEKRSLVRLSRPSQS